LASSAEAIKKEKADRVLASGALAKAREKHREMTQSSRQTPSRLGTVRWASEKEARESAERAQSRLERARERAASAGARRRGARRQRRGCGKDDSGRRGGGDRGGSRGRRQGPRRG